jgi:hypothetical protein
MSDQKQQQSHYALAFLLTAITLFSLARPDLLWLLLMPVCLLLLALEKRLHQQPAYGMRRDRHSISHRAGPLPHRSRTA